jgi:basic membrane lipoprotein Med (substrate-binding protein (PBP1-ABC) superfamily)
MRALTLEGMLNKKNSNLMPEYLKGPHWGQKVFLFAALLAPFLVPAQLTAGEFKVGLVLDRGGKDDKSFNSSAYEGATRAKGKLGVFVKYVEAADDNAFEPMLRAFAQRDFDLIIGIGFAQKDPIKKVAAQFPKKHFAIVDAGCAQRSVAVV